MKKRTLLATVVASLLLPAVADAKPLEQSYTDEYVATVQKLGKRAPGRNIRRHGVLVANRSGRGHHVRPALRREMARAIEQMRRLRAPVSRQLVRKAVPPGQPPAGVQTASVAAAPGSHLSAIARCESGGNPGAISPGGQYRGKYQFDYGTWASVGGSGDPAAASEAEQDLRAAILYGRAGAAPWPVCGQ